MKRGPNGVDEKARLLRLPRELDEAITEVAAERELTAAEWIRQVLARAVKRAG